MPYLTIAAPAFSFEQKKIMADELTGTLSRILELADDQQERLLIQFLTYHPDSLAVGGRLISETETPLYRLTLHGHRLTSERRQRIADEIMPLAAQLLGLSPLRGDRLHMVFRQDEPDDVMTSEPAWSSHSSGV